MAWYVGRSPHGLIAFMSDALPTHKTYRKLYSSVIGPFKTKRGALWAEKYGNRNPHFQTVNDAERLARLEINISRKET